MNAGVLALLLLLPRQFGERVEVRVLEVSATVRDESGRVPDELKPADFVLLEDGRKQRILDVTPLATAPAPTQTPATPPRPRRVVVYIQQSLSTSYGLRTSLQSLAAEAERLVAIGEVEVVTDFPRPHVWLAATRDAAALRSALQQELVGHEEVIALRYGLRATDLRDDPGQTPADPGTDALAFADQARRRARQEWLALRSREDALVSWLSRYRDAAKTLLFVSDGFDLEPSFVDAHEAVAHALAAEGWTIVSVASPKLPVRSTHFETFSHEMRPGNVLVDVVGNAAGTTLNHAPLTPLERLADATGGGVATDAQQVAQRIDDLAARVVISYVTDHRAGDVPRRIELRAARAGLVVTAQKWVGGSTAALADASSESVARVIASGDESNGGALPVTCAIRLGPLARGIRNGELEVGVDLAPIADDLAGLDDGALRVTLAVIEPNGKPFTTTRRLEHLDFTAANGWSSTISVRHRNGAKFAVVATEASTGAWGSCLVAAGQ